MTSDAELLHRARSDPAAFRELYDRYADQILSFHRGRTLDIESAFDLTAETFAQAWARREHFRDEAGGSAGPWLYGIAHHILFRSVRRGRMEQAACDRLGLLERLDRPVSTAQPAEEWLEGLDEALGELPEAQRKAVLARIVDDASYDEIARSTASSEVVARARVSRGLASLRNRLSEPKEASQ